MNQVRKEPELWKKYYQIFDLIRKKALRIRDDAHGLRRIELSQDDAEFKKVIEQSFFLLDLSWKDYGIKWHLKPKFLANKLRQGVDREELLHPNNWMPVKKTTKKL